MKFIFLQILFFLSYNLFAQSYIEYQRTFNRIDEDIFNENYNGATERLDSIYSEYDFIYAKHCIKALQVCCKVNDSLRADSWLSKCFKQGIPLWIIRTDILTSKSLEYFATQNTIQSFDSLRSIYKSSINLIIAKQIDSLLTIDQEFTKKVNEGFPPFRYTSYNLQWKQNNKKQFDIINQITNNYGFPGEKLIGVPSYLEDSSRAAKYIANHGLDLNDYRAYLMLIHYFSNPRESINEKLYENVINGYLPVYQYGAINDFMARWGKKKFGDFFYYNVWHHDPFKGNIEYINKRRNQIGLNTYEQQQRNMQINIERRKNTIKNFEVVTE